MAKTRVKTDAPDFPVPQSAEEANLYIEQIGSLQRRRANLETGMNDALAQLKAHFEELAAPIKTELEERKKGLQVWCAANRAQLTQDGKRKSYAFAAGEVQWRMRPPSIRLKGAEDVLKHLLANGFARFVRVKQEIDKAALLKEPEVAESIKGVAVVQGEDFVVKPFETELEEVADA